MREIKIIGFSKFLIQSSYPIPSYFTKIDKSWNSKFIIGIGSLNIDHFMDDDDTHNDGIETIHVVGTATPKQPLNKNEHESGRRGRERNLKFIVHQSDNFDNWYPFCSPDFPDH